MTLGHRTLRRSLLLTTVLLACTAPPSEVETGITTGSGPGEESTAGPGPGPGTVADSSDSGVGTMGATDDTGPSFDPICGDGVVETPEECDLGDLNGTGMYCTLECTSNVCGDGYAGPGEACDDGNQDNTDLCTTDCGPTSCGDGVVQDSEQCDAGKKNSLGGACLPSCVLATCGDQFIQEGVETCDSDNIGFESCMSQDFDRGVLLCAPDCMSYDTSNCYECGNGVLEPGENCDGTVYTDDVTCADFAMVGQMVSGGALSCTTNCTVIDSSACTFCGNGVQEGAEDCDGMDFDGDSCATFALPGDTVSGGALTCSNTCVTNSSSCTYCGDALIEGDEDCEAGMLDGETCESVGMGFDGGMLGCTNCSFNVTGCTTCGNGMLEGMEQCDGGVPVGSTCATVVGPGNGGMLTCDMPTCTFDTDACCLNAGQPCMGAGQCCNNCVGPGGSMTCN
jgi:hypothetical protein